MFDTLCIIILFYIKKYIIQIKFSRYYLLRYFAQYFEIIQIMRFLYFYLTAFLYLVQPRYLQSEIDNLLNNGNLTSGVNFNPSLDTPQRVLLNELQGWTIDQIEQGLGNFYNPRWGNKPVISLDYFKNFFLRQSFFLMKGTYTFSMKYAARVGWIGSSGLSIYWNYQRALTIFPTDQLIHQLRIQLFSSGSLNVLQIRGEGIEDSYGMTIADLKLNYLSPISQISYEVNLMDNQMFYIPKSQSSDIKSPSWQSKQISKSTGYLINKRWGLSEVIQINQLKNQILMQNFSLRSQYYVFQTDYAAPTNFTGKSGLSIFWNGNLIKRVIPQDQNLHRLSLVLLGTNGQNILIIRLEPQLGDSAIAINNLHLIPTNASYSSPISIKGQIPIPKQNEVTLIPSSDFDSEMTNYIPYWQSRGFSEILGNQFNPQWLKKVVLINDPYSNGFLKRKVTLQKGKYQFKVDYAVKDKAQVISRMILYINGEQAALISPKNYNISSMQVTFQVNSPGQFNLELKGDPNMIGDGLSIYNPELVSINPVKNIIPLIIPNKPYSNIITIQNQKYQLIPYGMGVPSQIIIITNKKTDTQPNPHPQPAGEKKNSTVFIVNQAIDNSSEIKTSTVETVGNIEIADDQAIEIANKLSNGIPVNSVNSANELNSTPKISNQLVQNSSVSIPKLKQTLSSEQLPKNDVLAELAQKGFASEDDLKKIQDSQI